jgi:hypothetical protein
VVASLVVVALAVEVLICVLLMHAEGAVISPSLLALRSAIAAIYAYLRDRPRQDVVVVSAWVQA